MYLDNDLVDAMKPGDRVQIVGVYRAMTGAAATSSTSGVFRTVVIANGVRTIGKDVGGLTMTPEDIQSIREVAKREDAFELLTRSVAPSIFGHAFIKKAILLLLLGGVEVNLDNGTHIRGDINILMVGDPSTAKSQVRAWFGRGGGAGGGALHGLVTGTGTRIVLCSKGVCVYPVIL